jgi:hypothetical protein
VTDQIISNALGDERFEALQPLLRELAITDPRARLVDWDTVVAELKTMLEMLTGKAEQHRPEPWEETLAKAKRLGDLPAMREAATASTREQEIKGWLEKLQSQLYAAAAEVQPKLEEIREASHNAIAPSVSTGWFSLAEVASIRRDVLPPGLVFDATIGARSAQALFIIVEPHGIQFCTFGLALYVLRQEGSVWIVRVPAMQFRAERVAAIPDWLWSMLGRVSGPHPVLLEQSLSAARDFAHESAARFVDVVGRYAEGLIAGRDPRDSSTWQW